MSARIRRKVLVSLWFWQVSIKKQERGEGLTCTQGRGSCGWPWNFCGIVRKERASADRGMSKWGHGVWLQVDPCPWGVGEGQGTRERVLERGEVVVRVQQTQIWGEGEMAFVGNDKARLWPWGWKSAARGEQAQRRVWEIPAASFHGDPWLSALLTFLNTGGPLGGQRCSWESDGTHFTHRSPRLFIWPEKLFDYHFNFFNGDLTTQFFYYFWSFGHFMIFSPQEFTLSTGFKVYYSQYSFYLFLNQLYLPLFPPFTSNIILSFLLPEHIFVLTFQRSKICWCLCYRLLLSCIDSAHFYVLLICFCPAFWFACWFLLSF